MYIILKDNIVQMQSNVFITSSFQAEKLMIESIQTIHV